MPRIQVPQEWFSDDGIQSEAIPEAVLTDFLFQPVKPQQEEEVELTHEQRHESGFQGEAYQGQQLGGLQEPGTELPLRKVEEDPRAHHKPLHALSERNEPAAGSDLCVFGGWPRRHVRVGDHCPHGMLDTIEMLKEQERNDEQEA